MPSTSLLLSSDLEADVARLEAQGLSVETLPLTAVKHMPTSCTQTAASMPWGRYSHSRETQRDVLGQAVLDRLHRASVGSQLK